MSTQKPMVGITGDFRPERYNGAALSWFNTGYYDSITAAGGLPMLLPPLENDDDLNRMMENVAGVVISGCNLDLDPTRMKMHIHPSVKVMPKRREDFDRRVAEYGNQATSADPGHWFRDAVGECSVRGHIVSAHSRRRSTSSASPRSG
ncbi:MAG: gamma-glutamyl-gamma-aminobutyrate hydrolase family protein [Burkholderiaceae bacterium]